VPTIGDGHPEDWFGPGKRQLCYYPNRQEATALCCHDHAMGVNRFNIFAELMSGYPIRDEIEQALGLPSGKYELPLLLFDRSFTPQGQLYYPNPPEEGVWAQEFLGDAMLLNGKVRPYHEVEPRQYRLRIANTANSRFFSLSFSNRQSFHVIGADQGLVPARVDLNRFVLAPAERADLVVDFSGSGGESNFLRSDEFELMQFGVSKEPVSDDGRPPKALRPVERNPENRVARTRVMTLDELDDDSGMAMVMLLNRKRWADPVTERVRLVSVEIWNLANLTQDTHPKHLHMVRFQVLDRRSSSVDDYLASNTLPLRYTGCGHLSRSARIGLERCGPMPAGDRNAHHYPVRGICRPVSLALPRPRARGQRDDASLRSVLLSSLPFPDSKEPRCGGRFAEILQILGVTNKSTLLLASV